MAATQKLIASATGLCLSVALALLAIAGTGEAQGASTPRIAVLLRSAAPPPGQPHAFVDAFRAGLRERGYVEGQNVAIEYRWAGGREQRLSELAGELVRLNVAVIVTDGTPATLAAKAATSTIPIVMTSVGDPVGSGLVASLARPGTNVTGFSLLDVDLDGKRIELLRDALPGITRIAVLWSANDPGMALAFGRVESAARTLRINVQSLAVREADDFPRAFESAGAGRAEALVVIAQPFTVRHQAQILDRVMKHRLPAMYTDRRFVDAGGLMAYGSSLVDLYRRAAGFVDKILKGARPADLPVEQPIKFEFVLNLKTAKALGLAIPPSVVVRGDHVIE